MDAVLFCGGRAVIKVQIQVICVCVMGGYCARGRIQRGINQINEWIT